MDVKRDLLDVTRDLVLTVGYSSDILHPNVLEKRPDNVKRDLRYVKRDVILLAHLNTPSLQHPVTLQHTYTYVHDPCMSYTRDMTLVCHI